MAEISFNNNIGSRLGIEYTAYLHKFRTENESKFIKAEKVIVNISEDIVSSHNPKPKDPIEVSDEGKTITIDFKMSRYRDNKGELTPLDSPTQFFSTLNFVIERAVRIDKGKEVQ